LAIHFLVRRRLHLSDEQREDRAMNAASLPRRLFSWVYRWWRQRVAPRRRPITHSRKLSLEALEHRSAPTNFGLASSAELAPPPPACRI
jgi:hypothetical protein